MDKPFHLQTHKINTLFSVILFLLFMIVMFLTIAISALDYHHTDSLTAKNQENRTAVSYLTQKIHQCDSDGSILLSSVGTSDALGLLESPSDSDSTGSFTYFYCYQNSLWECQAAANDVVHPGDGAPSIPMRALSIDRISATLYALSITDTDDNTQTVYLSFRTRQQ